MYHPAFLQLSFSPRVIKFLLVIVIVIATLRTLFLYYEVSIAAQVDHIASSRLPSHRENHCLPRRVPNLSTTLKALQSSCNLESENPAPRVRVTTATAHFGKIEETYQRALRTHVLHTKLHHQKLEVMCTPVVDDLWNKPAFLLSMLLDEMLKPRKERTEWIFWVDRDTIILDQCRPVSSFLPCQAPPASGEGENSTPEDEVQLLVTEDWNGLNNGVFLLRVGQWAIELFSAILAFRYYRPDVALPFTEQSAMEFLMKESKFEKGTRFVPQSWFNTYPGGNASSFLEREDEEGLADYQARRGDFLIHFAGVGNREKAMGDWLDMLQTNGSSLATDTERVQRNATMSSTCPPS